MLVLEINSRCILYSYDNIISRDLAIDRCREVIKLARKYNLLVLCDDVYNLLHFPDKAAPKRLYAYDDRYVVYNSPAHCTVTTVSRVLIA